VLITDVRGTRFRHEVSFAPPFHSHLGWPRSDTFYLWEKFAVNSANTRSPLHRRHRGAPRQSESRSGSPPDIAVSASRGRTDSDSKLHLRSTNSICKSFAICASDRGAVIKAAIALFPLPFSKRRWCSARATLSQGKRLCQKFGIHQPTFPSFDRQTFLPEHVRSCSIRERIFAI